MRWAEHCRYLKEVRENGRDVAEANLLFFTHLSRWYWGEIEQQNERFEQDIRLRAEGRDFGADLPGEDWLFAQRKDREAFLRDVFGRLCGQVSGLAMSELLGEQERQESVSEDGDDETRERAEGILRRPSGQ